MCKARNLLKIAPVYKRGFTMLELSIVLIIISIILSGILAAGQSQLDAYYLQITNNNMNIVKDALIQYVANNGELPCPADFNSPKSDVNYGRARVSSGVNGLKNCITSSNNIYYYNSGNDVVYMGAVPARALGLIDDFMFDGWNNKISYVVQKAFINSAKNTSCIGTTGAADLHSSNTYMCFAGQASGSINQATTDITILDYVGGRSINNDAIVVLISHGKNGLGGFTRNADGNGANIDRNALPSYQTQIDERANTNCDPNSNNCSSTLLFDAIFSTGSPKQNYGYDDIVMFLTRNQVVYKCNLAYGQMCFKSSGIGIN